MKKTRKLLSVLLALVMIISAFPMSSFALFGKGRAVSSLPFVSISDVHFYPESLMGDKGDAWMEYCRLGSKMYNESEAILRTALETIGKRAEKSGAKYVLVPGDLTKDSEYEAHKAVAEIFEEYEAKYGLEFLVINGNHDINTTKACTFENGKKEQARAITSDEFKGVYKNLGYDLAIDEFETEHGDVRGKLSYVADLDEDFRLIAIDSGIYSFGEPETDRTEGEITPELIKWVDYWVNDAEENGKTAFVMLHHGLAPHMKIEPSVTQAFPLNNYIDTAEHLASLGVNYAFTGHLHTNDISSTVNDEGDVLYDIETASLTGYPNSYRENELVKRADGTAALTSDAVDFDDAEKMTFGGVTYDNNSYKKTAFDLCFGGAMKADGKADATAFLVGIVKSYAQPYMAEIVEKGGVIPFLKTMGVDLEKILSDFLKPYIGNGFKLAGYNIFSVENLMWFIEDLLSQITELYIKNPDALFDLLTSAVNEIMSIEVSDKPCTRFIDSLGFGSRDRNGNLGDAVLTAMTYWYLGNEDSSDDAFILDVIDKLENGDTASKIFYKLIDVVLGDVLEDGLLSKIEIRVDKLLGDDYIQKHMGEGINYLLYHVLKGNFSYMNLVNTVFALGVLPYDSLYDIIDKLALEKFLTDSQLESFGIFIAYVLADFSSDENPKQGGDSGVTYTSEKVEVKADTENYRIPTMVSVTMGEDSKTEATINWFSKSTLGGDIEIYKAEKEPRFTGVPTSDAEFSIDTETKTVERSFPGIDLGVIGLFNYAFNMKQHTVKLSGLEPGSKYYFRVGDAQHGWWSEAGSVKTADGGKNTVFFHMTDPQAQNLKQYNRAWKTVLETAFDKYPEAGFIIETGDLVDHGDNNKHWQYMFDSGSKNLMNTFFMPATGNHEGRGVSATANRFVLPNVPQQNTETGVYYSFDYNNVHFAVLNTEDLGADKALSKQQLDWLRADMQKSDADWKFVAFHKAVYSQGSHYSDDDVCALRGQLGSIMPELGIDMVFQGHDHVYMRTGSLISNAVVPENMTNLLHGGNSYKTKVLPVGTSYVITGCAGVKSYVQNDVTKTDKYFPRAEKLFSANLPMFAAVEIEDGVLYFDAYSVKDGKAFSVDRFAIQKNLVQGEVDPNPPADDEKDTSFSDFMASVKAMLENIIRVLKVLINIVRIYIWNVAP